LTAPENARYENTERSAKILEESSGVEVLLEKEDTKDT
jgi:hypothetical protein